MAERENIPVVDPAGQRTRKGPRVIGAGGRLGGSGRRPEACAVAGRSDDVLASCEAATVLDPS